MSLTQQYLWKILCLLFISDACTSFDFSKIQNKQYSFFKSNLAISGQKCSDNLKTNIFQLVLSNEGGLSQHAMSNEAVKPGTLPPPPYAGNTQDGTAMPPCVVNDYQGDPHVTQILAGNPKETAGRLAIFTYRWISFIVIQDLQFEFN
ncbi:Hypothetical_protein [Hexamita inflata]|uniref:Hypothetical_protein n=1 Tax=Hexamita inflata TaxID=28002 RepID=A0AA86P1B9_9EUKA|nr:Hypothetical protein HINF_LOCUS16909 [Hexamita inflata]CAI9929265.1 Hypothetical protein HINF_LOCUS16910 [Hexamita inflata]